MIKETDSLATVRHATAITELILTALYVYNDVANVHIVLKQILTSISLLKFSFTTICV